MTRLIALACAVALAACGAQAQPPGSAPVRVEAAALPLDPNDAAATRLGDFAYAGGVALASPDTSRLHGLSALRLAADGSLAAVSDEGDLLRARLVLTPDGMVAGLADAVLTPLTGLDGQSLHGKREADAEGLVVWPAGDLMVSFERDHRIWLYPSDGGPPRAAPRPDADFGNNEGMEGLALAPSRGPDAYWVGSEGGLIWLCRLSARCEREPGIPRPGLGSRLSALVEAPGGDLVVLHAGFNPVTRANRLTGLILRLQPGRGAQVAGKLTIGSRLTVDNYEGVDVTPLRGGGLRLYLLSDDNFTPHQRTLLSAFDWRPPAP